MEFTKEQQEYIEKYYLRYPLDADGVPIHVGDTIEYPNGRRDVVRFITVNDNMPTFNERGWVASKCRHVKPDPLKELLEELANEVWEASCTCQTTLSDSGLDGIEERYAERIRELMGGDAE